MGVGSWLMLTLAQQWRKGRQGGRLPPLPALRPELRIDLGSYCTAHGILFNVMWQLEWDSSLGEKDKCICMSPFAVHLNLSQHC